MINIIEHILPKSAARPMLKLRKFSGVTIHETGNYSKGANAKAHDIYLHVNGGMNKQVSYHNVVDDKEAYLLIPYSEIAWHAGDGGAGKGNCETVAIEICVNPECDKAKARENAMWLAAKILRDHGITKVIDGTKDKANGNLFQHNTFSSYGKNCPQIIRGEGLWEQFVNGVSNFLYGNNAPVQPNTVPNITDISVGDKVVIKAGALYSGASKGKLVPAWVVGKTFIVGRINGTDILLNEINSWVSLEYLQQV